MFAIRIKPEKLPWYICRPMLHSQTRIQFTTCSMGYSSVSKQSANSAAAASMGEEWSGLTPAR